jgi:hypothetical protein
MELSTDLTKAYLYCTLETTRSTPSTSYILVQYQQAVTFGTSLQAGANVTVTGNGSTATPYVISGSGGSASISSTAESDTAAANLDVLTDNSSASGSTVAYKYKTLTAGSGIRIAGSSGAITVSATGSGLSKSVYAIAGGTVISDAGTLLVSGVTQGTQGSPPLWSVAGGTDFYQGSITCGVTFYLRWSASNACYQLVGRSSTPSYTTGGTWYLTVVN